MREESMEKIDMKKTHEACYTATKTVKFVDVPAVSYITYQSAGDPNVSQDFQDAMGVLYGLAYTIKFASKADGRDFTVMPLEEQWRTENPAEFSEQQKGEWQRKVMIAVPEKLKTIVRHPVEKQ